MQLILTRIFVLLTLTTLITACSTPDLSDTQGNAVYLKDNTGRWTVINVWSEWCDYCRTEISELNILANQGKIRIIGYDFDNSTGRELDKKIKALKIRFPVVIENPIVLFGIKMLKALPATLIINPNGELLTILYSAQNQNSIENKIKQLQKKG